MLEHVWFVDGPSDLLRFDGETLIRSTYAIDDAIIVAAAADLRLP